MTSRQLTVITPIAPHHRDHAARAAQSVSAQTIPVDHLTMVDTAGYGPGWVRNRLLERVTTPFVTFLDADDVLDSRFAETVLQHTQPNRYVYTDWYHGDDMRHEAARPFNAGAGFHLVTAVVATEDARRVGGFDEHLRGVEDRDFYLKLTNFGVCPLRVALPLVTYTTDGRRSLALGRDAAYIKSLVDTRWDMDCCGDNSTPAPTGKQDGDILAVFVTETSRREQGVVSGRLYVRTGANQPIWADPRDVAAMPRVFRVVEPLKPQPVTESGSEALMSAMEKGGVVRPDVLVSGSDASGAISPDFGRVIELGAREYAD